MNRVSPFAGSAAYINPEDASTYLGERIRYTYRELIDSKTVQTSTGETLRTLATKHLSGLANLPTTSAGDFFWIIGDFQPAERWEPWMEDPTLPIPIGTVVVIPSERVASEVILPRLVRPTTEVDDG